MLPSISIVKKENRLKIEENSISVSKIMLNFVAYVMKLRYLFFISVGGRGKRRGGEDRI